MNAKKLKFDESLFEKINELLRQGQGIQAKSQLLSIDTRKLGGEPERVQYANLARRLSLPNEALKVLNPIVRPSSHIHQAASPAEKIEYAASLIRVGAVNEAINILKEFSNDTEPKALLIRAFAHIALWDYKNAIGFLEGYLKDKQITKYEKLVAQANLCEALVYQKALNASLMIENTLQEAKENKYTIIFGHLQMTRAIYCIDKQDWGNAKAALLEAEKCFINSETSEAFYVRKWKAILEFTQDSEHNKQWLNKIRSEAEEKHNQWETLRDCDLHEAILKKNKELFHRLYFGTPYPHYRAKLLKIWNEICDRSQTYEWNLNTGKTTKKCLEFFSGKSAERKKLLKAKKQVASVFGVLASDFYRPMRTAYIFSRLFPNEFFNPISSPARVRFAIYNLRKWLKSEKYPITILEEDGAYTLSSEKPIALLIPENLVAANSESVIHQTDLLKSLLVKKDIFTVQEASLKLDLSRRSTNRLLALATQKGILVRNGTGSTTYYTWAKKK